MTEPAVLPPLAPVTVPLRSKRHERALVAQKVQHVIPATGLFLVGMQALGEGAHGGELALALVQLVTSGGLVVNFIRHVRAARRAHTAAHAHHGVDWFEIFSAGVLLVEAYERWHLKHHIARPVILTAIATLVMGLMHGRLSARIARHRVLHVDEHGVRVGGKFWRTFAAPWPQISAITIDAKVGEIRTRSGLSRRLRLTDLHDEAQVRQVLASARDHVAALRASTPNSPTPNSQTSG